MILNPCLSLVSPYGVATPVRVGFSLTDWQHSDGSTPLTGAIDELYSFVGDGWEQEEEEEDIILLTLRRSAARS